MAAMRAGVPEAVQYAHEACFEPGDARVLNEKAALNIQSLAGPNANISSTAGR